MAELFVVNQYHPARIKSAWRKPDQDLISDLSISFENLSVLRLADRVSIKNKTHEETIAYSPLATRYSGPKGLSGLIATIYEWAACLFPFQWQYTGSQKRPAHLPAGPWIR